MLLKKTQQFSPNIIELRFIKTKTEVSIYTIAESELCEQKMIYYRHLIPNQNNARKKKETLSVYTLYRLTDKYLSKVWFCFVQIKICCLLVALHRSGALRPAARCVVFPFEFRQTENK